MNHEHRKERVDEKQSLSDQKKQKRILVLFIGICLIVFIIFIYADNACNNTFVHARNLMDGITENRIEEIPLNDGFLEGTAKFSVSLLKETALQCSENVLLSPPSLLYALAMTTNGAKGETREQMQQVLNEGISIEELNQYFYTMKKSMDQDRSHQIKIANGIWYNDKEWIKIKKDFLQTNADYYQAELMMEDTSNPVVLEEINQWIDRKTNGMIKKMDGMKEGALMYLVNAIAFQADWEVPYKEGNIEEGNFYNINGKNSRRTFLTSEESQYIENEYTKGFLKDYEGGKYSLAAFLPKDGNSIENLLEQLNGEKWMELMKSKQDTSVTVIMPEFQVNDYQRVKGNLAKLGIKDAFNPVKADFSRMGQSKNENIYIDQVFHKTFLTVDRSGTKGGAATAVELKKTAALPEMSHSVILDHPFLYAIVDKDTGLPIFIGVIRQLKNNPIE